MKISKALLSAILVGVTVQTTTSCSKKDAPEPKAEASQTNPEVAKAPLNCPACGMG